MYVCVYVCMYVCMHACMYVCKLCYVCLLIGCLSRFAYTILFLKLFNIVHIKF